MEASKINKIIKDLKVNFGSEYSFAKTEYIGAKSKVIITCLKHGDFLVRLDEFKRGNRCKLCKQDKKTSDLKIRLTKSLNKHSHQSYSFDKVYFINSKSKITITCLEHGDFKIFSRHFLSGHGCPSCSKYGKKNKEAYNKELIEYGNQNGFDTSKISFVKAIDKIIVGCHIHGDFLIKPYNFLKGGGCPSCAKNSKLSQKEALNKLEESRIKYHDSKDYSFERVIYKTAHEKIEVKCPEHSFFKISFHSFINGRGCRKCADEYISKLFLLKEEEALNNLSKLNKYILDKVSFKSRNDIITLGCKKHNIYFKSTYEKAIKNNHTCPLCFSSGFNINKPAILYYILIEGKYYKIGVTNKSIEIRYKNSGVNYKVIQEWFYDYGKEALEQEQLLLKEFSFARVKDCDILKNNGRTELFYFDILNLDY